MHLNVGTWKLILLTIIKMTSLVILLIFWWRKKHMKLVDLMPVSLLLVLSAWSILNWLKIFLVLQVLIYFSDLNCFRKLLLNWKFYFFSGNDLHSVWYSPPPFGVHHCARRTVEFALENQYDSSASKPFPLTITYQQDGGFLIEVFVLL